MKLCMSGMLCALSAALDCVESEVFGVTTHHSRRVAYLCIRMGEPLGYREEQLAALAGAAVMHDNALTEYLAVRHLADGQTSTEIDLGPHCEMGEKNMRRLPLYGLVQDVVLYHHENADGSGPFGKTAAETPAFAQMIHIADQMDNSFNLSEMSPEKYRTMRAWLEASSGALFAPELVSAVLGSVTYADLEAMQGENILPLLSGAMPD